MGVVDPPCNNCLAVNRLRVVDSGEFVRVCVPFCVVCVWLVLHVGLNAVAWSGGSVHCASCCVTKKNGRHQESVCLFLLRIVWYAPSSSYIIRSLIIVGC